MRWSRIETSGCVEIAVIRPPFIILRAVFESSHAEAVRLTKVSCDNPPADSGFYENYPNKYLTNIILLPDK